MNNHPIPGHQYRLTGGGNEPAISNGNSWEESRIGGPSDTAAKIRARIEQFAQVVTALNVKYYQDMHYTFESPPLATVEYGRRYAKIMRGNTVHSFIDIANGNVLKAATYKSPAKGVRGNIFADDCGRSAIDHFGANYLR